MALSTDLGLLEGFSGVRSLHKIANAQKSQTKAIRDASSQASKDAARLRTTIEDTSSRLEAAQREGNQVLVQQLQVQQQGLQLQQQQVESQLRIEQAQSAQRALEANDDEMVSAMWACVEGAKNNLKDRKYYSSLIFGVNARLAYGQLIPQAQKSDTKMKLSQLNDEARDILDQLLIDNNFQPTLSEATPLFDSLKSLITSTSSLDAENFFENHSKAVQSIDTASNDLAQIIASINKLKADDQEIEDEQDKLKKAIDDLSQIESILTPISEESIRDFLSAHSDEVHKLKTQLEASTGIGIESTLKSVDQFNTLLEKLTGLRNQLSTTIASAQMRLGDTRNAMVKARMKKRKQIFWILIIVWILVPAVAQENPAITTIWGFGIFGLVAFWYVMRMQKKKIQNELGLGSTS